MSSPHVILTVRCHDTIGIVSAISTALAESRAFIVESSHFGDAETRLFFMRTVFRPTGNLVRTLDDFRIVFAPIAKRFGMELALHEAERRTKVLLAVSKHGHCLNHLLHQWHGGELPVDVVGVVSNHEDMRRLVEWYGLPYHHLPMAEGKAAQEARFRDAIASSGAQLTVLARYMQVLSNEMCGHLEGRCINIHHSFLPGFKGARPYHQAFARGVKVVGATAHYVTSDLDEGPIIEQETHRVSHALDADAFVRNGKDIENVVLSRAVRWHAEHRVMLNGSRTVVFQ
jgi:formyltetrahydrofolate deformylase